MTITTKKKPSATPKVEDPDAFPASIHLGGAHSYLFDNEVRLAVRMAWATSRPLLVVGEAGCGKTQLAQALGAAWRVPCIAQTIHARTDAQDLFFHFDAVARLSDAQVRGVAAAAGAGKESKASAQSCDPLNPAHYLRPGPLWWALNAESALALNADRPAAFAVKPPADLPPNWTGGASVVLLDEVDKGSDELAESLLEVLDARCFTVPWTGQKVSQAPTTQPFLLMTSNGSRPLPPPFLRRCIVLAMHLPEEPAALVPWLAQRARAHFTARQVKDAALARAAELICEDRSAAKSQQRYKPGVAEYLYLCEAVAQLAASKNAEQQCALIEGLAPSVTRHKGEANRAH
jgi:MoxR-like ATPase